MSRDCARRLVEASKGEDGIETLSVKDAKNLLDEVKKLAEFKSRDGSDLNENIIAELTARKIRAKVEGNLQKRNAAINLIKRKELTIKIQDLVAEGLTPRKAIQAILVGVQGVYSGGRLSIDAKHKTLTGRYLGSFIGELEKEGLLPILTKRGLQEEIEKELWAIGNSNGTVGLTKSPEALKIAKIIYKHNESLRIRQNKAGAAISKLDGFTISQSHDRLSIAATGYTAWRNKILPLLDVERTFKGADPNDFLKSVYEVITTGISKKKQESDKLFEFKGYANLAKKISRERVLHFRDAESSIAYRKEFGNKDFTDSFIESIEGTTRNIALMETLGTNPRAMFDLILQETKNNYRDDPKRIKGLINDRMIRNYYNEIDGTSMMAESPTFARISSVLRAGQGMSKLGGALLSSISDVPLKALELQYQGFSFLESYAIPLRDATRFSTTSEHRQFASSLGVGMDGMIGAIVSRFSAQDDLPGTVSKLQRLFFKLNGLQWWTDAQKTGTAMAMSHRLAQFSGLSFNELDESTRRLFKIYNIEEKDWNAIRKANTKNIDGNNYITPEDISDSVASEKFRTYISDRVDFATLSPGAQERAFLTQGLKRGTVEGELLRFFSQFKSFPVTMISKTYGRILYGKGKADVPALVQTAIMTSIFGYLAMSAKDIVKGRQPRPLDNPNTLKAAFMQGGGAGILGDFALGEYNRFGQDFTTTLAGPTFSSLNELAKLYSSAKAGDDTAAKSLNFLTNNAPFANLFYVKPVLNYMFLYQMQESLNPGYLRRMEKRVKKENNQKFLIKPSEVVK